MTGSAQPKINLLSEGIALALLTVAAYAVAFAYEAGFAGYYGIPLELITTSTNVLLKAAAALLFGITSYMGIAMLVWQFVPRSETLIAKKVRQFVAVALLLGLGLSPFLLNGEAWVPFLLLAGFFGFFEFVFPLITQRKKSGYAAKIEAQDQLEKETYRYTLVGVLMEKGIRQLIYFVIVISSACVFAYGLGSQNAKSKSEYFLLNGNDDEVALAIYGDVLVSSKFDIKSHELKGGLLIHKLADSKVWRLQTVKVGRLKPSPSSVENTHKTNPLPAGQTPSQGVVR